MWSRDATEVLVKGSLGFPHPIRSPLVRCTASAIPPSGAPSSLPPALAWRQGPGRTPRGGPLLRAGMRESVPSGSESWGVGSGPWAVPQDCPLLGAGMRASVPSGSGSWTSAHLLEVHRWVPLLGGVAQRAAPLPLWALRAHVRHKSAAGRACRVRTRVRRGRADLSARAVLLVCCTSRRSAGASR